MESIHGVLQSHCPSMSDAEALLSKVFTKCSDFLPDLSLDDIGLSRLIQSLGHLRASVSDAFRISKIHVPSISVASLDRVVCNLGRTRDQLQAWGYNIQRQAFSSALNDQPSDLSSSSRNLGGRPSKVLNNDCVRLVKDKLKPYLKESERILVIGRGAKRQMVVAQHLTKRRRAIYMLERELSKTMSYQVFMKILKIHLPHVKNPRRKTDICSSAQFGNFLFAAFVWDEPGRGKGVFLSRIFPTRRECMF